jgi:hypothetical protein
VKRLTDYESPGGDAAFQREVEMISVAVHRNLLRLIGFCTTPTERLLVYPFMQNLSVAYRLRGISSVSNVCEWYLLIPECSEFDTHTDRLNRCRTWFFCTSAKVEQPDWLVGMPGQLATICRLEVACSKLESASDEFRVCASYIYRCKSLRLYKCLRLKFIQNLSHFKGENPQFSLLMEVYSSGYGK